MRQTMLSKIPAGPPPGYGGKALGLLIVLVLLGAAGGGGYWMYKNDKLPDFITKMGTGTGAGTGTTSTSGGGAESGIYTLAVGTFADNAQTPEHLRRIVNDVFYSSLDETKKFKLIERGRMDDLEKEFLLTGPKETPDTGPAFGQIDPKKSIDDATKTIALNTLINVNQKIIDEGQVKPRVAGPELTKIKTLTKADYYLLGVITDFYSEQQTTHTDALGRNRSRSALTINLEARVVNTETGEIVTAPTVLIEEPRISGVSGNPLADRMRKLEIETARKAARKLSFGIVNALYPISVSEVGGGKVYLNRGAGLGVEKGDIFKVLSQGRPIIDPDTQKPIGRIEEEMGEVVVSEALDKMSIATIVSDGAKLEKGMIARPIRTAAKDGPAAAAPAAGAGPAPVVPAAADGRKAVAILPLRNTAKADPKVIDDLQTYFYTELGQWPEVKLIERQQLQKVLTQELNLTEDGYVSAETAIQVGRLTGAQYCLIGSLMQVGNKSSTTALRADLTMTQNRVLVEMDCRIIDTAKGEAWRTAGVTKAIENETPTDELRATALREAVREACQKLMGTAAAGVPSPAVPPSGGISTAPPEGGTPKLNPEQKVIGSFLVISPFVDASAGGAAAEMLPILDTNLESALVQTKRIPMVERTDDRFLDEMVFSEKAKGFIDPATIPKKGKLIGAKFYLATQVSRYAATAGANSTGLPNVYDNRWSVGAEIIAKLLEVETGRILETFQFEKNRSGSSESGTRMTALSRQMQSGMNDELGKEIAAELTGRILETLFPVLVADVSDTDIYLNQGDSTGIRPGLKFTVYNLGREITDPTTGRTIGRVKSRVGTITVTRAEREMAFAAPDTEKITAFTKGMECKTDRPAPEPVKTARVEAPPPPRKKAAPRPPETTVVAKVAEATPPPLQKTFALAPLTNSAAAPTRAIAALRDGVSRGIQTAWNTSVVTRNQDELAEIGREYLRGKSGLMDSATRLKAVKLAGCRYLVSLEITDWVSQVSTKQIPLTNQSIDVQEVQMRASGNILDLQTGKVVASSQARASSLDEGVDGAVVVDGQGNLDKEAQIAEKAAVRLVDEFRRAGVIE